MSLDFLEPVSGVLLTTAISTAVSLVVTSALLWWRRPKVQWVAVTSAYSFLTDIEDIQGNLVPEWEFSDRTSRVSLKVVLHNVGDASALNVSTDANGITVFGEAIVPSGGSLTRSMVLSREGYLSGELVVSYRQSPVRIPVERKCRVKIVDIPLEDVGAPLTRRFG